MTHIEDGLRKCLIYVSRRLYVRRSLRGRGKVYMRPI